MPETIRIDGLRQFRRALKTMDSGLPKTMRLALNSAADIVVAEAKPRVPRRSGRAAGSIRVASTQSSARVRGGGARVPYFAFLDFGGRVGPNRSVRRPFFKEGRYIWKAVGARRADVTSALEKALVGLAEGAGVEVS